MSTERGSEATNVRRTVYRESAQIGDLDPSSWNREKLKCEYPVLLVDVSEDLTKDQVALFNRLFAWATADERRVARAKSIIATPSISSKQRDGVLIAGAKLLIALREDVRANNPQTARIIEQVAKVFHGQCEFDDDKYVLLPSFLGLAKSEVAPDRFLTLARLLTACDIEKDDMATLIQICDEEPQVFNVMDAWRDVFKKRRKNISGVKIYPDSHQGKSRLNPLRLAPTRHEEYVDSVALAECYRRIRTVQAPSDHADAPQVIDFTKLTALKGLALFEGIEYVSDNVHIDKQVEWFKKNAAQDLATASERLGYFVKVLQQVDIHTASVLRVLWPLIVVDYVAAERWASAIAHLYVTHPQCVFALREYFVLFHRGITPSEVDAVLASAAYLVPEGIRLLMKMRRYAIPQKVLGNDEPLFHANLQPQIEMIISIPWAPIGSQIVRRLVSSVLDPVLASAYDDSKDIVLSPDCISFAANNTKTPDHILVVQALVCIFDSLADVELVRQYQQRIALLDVDTQLALVRSLKQLFFAMPGGKIEIDVVETLVKSAEVAGAAAFAIWHATISEWQRPMSDGRKKKQVDRTCFEAIRDQLLLDVPEHCSVVKKLAGILDKDSDSLSLQMLIDFLADLSVGQEEVVCHIVDRQRNERDEFDYRDCRALVNAARPGRLDVLAGVNVRIDFYDFDRAGESEPQNVSANSAKLYRDFISDPAYGDDPRILYTVLAYRAACVSLADSAWKASRAARPHEHPTVRVSGWRAKIASLFQAGRPVVAAPVALPAASRIDYVISACHFRAEKLIKKTAGLDDTAKSRVIGNMFSVVTVCRNNEAMFDYFLSIADHQNFLAMQKMSVVWYRDATYRDTMFAAFGEQAFLRDNVQFIAPFWDVFMWFKDLCVSEEGCQIASYIFKAKLNIEYWGAEGSSESYVHGLEALKCAWSQSLAVPNLHIATSSLKPLSQYVWSDLVSLVAKSFNSVPEIVSLVMHKRYQCLAMFIQWINERPERVLCFCTFAPCETPQTDGPLDTQWRVHRQSCVEPALHDALVREVTDPHWLQYAFSAIEMRALSKNVLAPSRGNEIF